MNERKESKIKTHLKKHKVKYIVGGSIVAAGGLGYYVGSRFGLKLDNAQMVSNIEMFNPKQSVLVNSNNNNTVTNVVNMGGRVKKMVKCVDTGEIWEKVSDAAKAAGVKDSVMSRHVNGHSNDIKGMQYKIIGLSTN
jgi:hypothetical protein